jgi:hypothetical protein
MSSLGGRCPKKLYIFLRDVAPIVDDLAESVGGTGSMAPGTPRLDMIDTVLALFVFLLATAIAGDSGSRVSPSRLTPMPEYRGEWGERGGGGMTPKKPSMFLRLTE